MLRSDSGVMIDLTAAAQRSIRSSSAAPEQLDDADEQRAIVGRALAPPGAVARRQGLLFVPFVATGAAHWMRLHASRLRWRLRGI